jgi:hypothetical protein
VAFLFKKKLKIASKSDAIFMIDFETKTSTLKTETFKMKLSLDRKCTNQTSQHQQQLGDVACWYMYDKDGRMVHKHTC